jgi:hypothetical protein
MSNPQHTHTHIHRPTRIKQKIKPTYKAQVDTNKKNVYKTQHDAD